MDYTIFGYKATRHELLHELERLGAQDPKLAMDLTQTLYDGALSREAKAREVCAAFEVLFAVADIRLKTPKDRGENPTLNPELMDKIERNSEQLSLRWDVEDLKKRYTKGGHVL